MTAMKRGDVVVVAATDDYGKPRPAVIVQTDAFPAEHASVVVCRLTSELTDPPHFRVTTEAKTGNGLRSKSQIMAGADGRRTAGRPAMLPLGSGSSSGSDQ
jgi:mRNA interferase MazF